MSQRRVLLSSLGLDGASAVESGGDLRSAKNLWKFPDLAGNYYREGIEFLIAYFSSQN